MVKLVFMGSDSLGVVTVVAWFLDSKGCCSFASDFRRLSTKGDDVPWLLDESDEDLVLHLLGCRCMGSSSAEEKEVVGSF